GRYERRRTVFAGAAEEREGAGQIFDGQPRFLGKAVRGQIIGIAARWSLADLQQAFFDAAFEVGVNESERDAEIGRKLALRLRAAALDRFEKAKHDPGIFGVFAARRLRHPPPLRGPRIPCSRYERQV